MLPTALEKRPLRNVRVNNTNKKSQTCQAHYIFRPTTGLLEYRCNLIAFQHIKGSHSGANLAMHFFALIDGLGVAHKVCSSLCFISKSL